MKLTRTFTILAVLLLLNLFCASTVYSQEHPQQPAGDEEVLKEIDRLMHVLQLIRKNYVDIDKVTTAELFKGALRGMTECLDDYSDFLVPKDYQSLMEDTDGKYGGIGVTVNNINGQVTIVNVVKGGPSDKAGVKVGDVIHAVDGKELTEDDLNNNVLRLRGEPGTKAKVTLLRPDEKGVLNAEAPVEVELVRAIITTPSVVAAQVLEGNIGFVRIKQFMEPTAEDLKKVLQDFEKQKVKGLVMDLRGNPGGLLESAVAICSFFLAPNSMVVTVKHHSDLHENRESEHYEEHRSRSGYKFNDKIKMIILVDGESASASEITAGCLRDHKRAVLLGTKTFGKGSVQSIINLDDGSAVKLTVARYYTPDPNRPTIDKNGIIPDITETIRSGVIRSLDQGFDEGKVDLEKDTQLMRALEVLRSFPVLER
ncbi:MAG: S41 family peptidase [Victivallales bacterium]|nr:S41 family peptidase [Victivallales bacterium]